MGHPLLSELGRKGLVGWGASPGGSSNLGAPQGLELGAKFLPSSLMPPTAVLDSGKEKGPPHKMKGS